MSPADSLRIRAEKLQRDTTERIVSDPRLLVEQSRAWIDAHASAFPTLLKRWEDLILARASSAQTMLQKLLAGQYGIDKKYVCSLKFTGRSIIYLAQCPFCEATCVPLTRIDPLVFKPPSAIKRMVFKPPCKHELPLTSGFMQFLLNVDAHIGEAPPNGHPCPDE